MRPKSETLRGSLASAAIRELGNAENESRGIEFGYVYDKSHIVAEEAVEISRSFVDYHPTTAPGARLPSTFLNDGSAIYDLLGPWFTILAFGGADPSRLAGAAHMTGAPVSVLCVDEERLFPIYQARLVLVRPDQHVAWRGNRVRDDAEALGIVRRSTGW